MDEQSLPPFLALVALVYVAVAYQGLRRPVPRRLAVRDVVRRPNETVLVIAGCLLGTALITGSYITGDTLDASIRATATTQLGPIDETITVADPDVARSFVRDIESLADPRIDGVMTMVAVPAAFASTASGADRAEPEGQIVELDFAEAASFGGDPAATGISGPPLAPGEVAVTEDLAGRLGARQGDEITAFLFGRDIRLQVSRVLPRLGLAGYWRGYENESPNAFVAPGTIAAATSGGLPPGAVPARTTILVSNRGGVEEGAELTEPVKGVLEGVLGEASGLRVDTPKKTTLDNAIEQGNMFSELFIAIGSFAIIAGILLLVNIFVMLAEERKNQLGMLRAVGMRRSDLVRSFVIEGTFYSLVAGALGAFLGIGVGWAIVKLAAPIFGSSEEFSLELRFAMDRASIVGGFCIGVLISMATVFFTSLRISRINIIRAIRDLPEPKFAGTRRRTLIAGATLTLVTAVWFGVSFRDESAWLPAILGPVLFAWGLVPLSGRFVRRHLAVIAASAFGLFWGVMGDTLLGGGFFDAGDLFAFVVQGVTLTFSAVVLLSQLQENLEGAIRRIAAARLSLRLGVAYPLARRFRTALSLGMFALVMFTMVFIAQMSAVFSGQVETTTRQLAGGFDMIVNASSANPPRVDALLRTEGVAEVAPLLQGPILYATEDTPDPKPWFAVGVDERFVAGAPELDEEQGPVDQPAVWRRVLEDPRTMIIDAFFLQAGGGPPSSLVDIGDMVTAVDPITGTRVEREVIGIVANDQAFNGSFMSSASLKEVLGPNAARSRFYVGVEDRADAAAVAARLQGDLVEHGVEADPFRTLVEEQNSQSVQFLNLMQGYLALGLLVGIAGLGVVMVRAVRERRREVGVLRSLGFQPSAVRGAFLLEAGFVAVEGILIGAVLALVTANQLVENGDFGDGLEFVIQWTHVSVLCAIAAVASLIATAWPAQQASAIPPAVALRVAD